MEDSDSGGLISTEEEHSGESESGNLETKVSKLKQKLKGFQQVVEERDVLRQEVQTLDSRVEELIVEREQLNAEHAQELAVLSSSLSEHLSQSSPPQDAKDSSCAKLNAQYEKEIQKLRLGIDDKNYHINNLQQKLLEAQLELETELDKHEEEIEDLRSRLGSRDKDLEKLVEERLNEVRGQYEKELEGLKSRIDSTGDEQTDGLNEESRSEYAREVEELKAELRKLEESKAGASDKDIEDRLEEERTKYRIEIMAVKDHLTHQHQVEIDGLITQLEQSNSELEQLKENLRQEKVNDAKAHSNSQEHSADNVAKENGPIQVKSFVVLNHDGDSDAAAVESLRAELHVHYQQQIEQVAQKLREEYQGELDESLSKMEEDWEQQLERQKNEYEEKIASLQRHLKNQYQNDLDQVTADMEEQIQTLRDSHSTEVAELLSRLRELSEERRKSVIQQDTTEQQVVIIREEYRSTVVSLQQELRVEKEKVVEYQRQMDAVEAQVQAFKAEKEQEVKMIEEELRRQCKALVEKKANELKERYQSELTEKLNNAEHHWRKQYDEDVGKTRSELEESNRTLKDKYERQVSDIMVQMDEVQQRSREVLQQEKKQFEDEQKERFEKQLSEVKDELQPFKDKCFDLERENKSLSEKYEKDLSELKSKMSEVEGRYEGDKGIEEEHLKTLRNELDLYKNKIQQLQDGKKSLMENYEAQLANLKKKYDDMEDGEIKTLQEEVNVYIKRATSLEEEKKALSEKYKAEVKSLKLTVEELTTEKESRKAEISSLEGEKTELTSRILELSQDLKSLKSKYAELEEAKEGMDNKNADELERLGLRIKDLQKDLEVYQRNCSELEEAKKTIEHNLNQEMESLRSKIEMENDLAQSREEQIRDLVKEKGEVETEFSKLKIVLEQLQTKYDDLDLSSRSAGDEHALEISRLERELYEARETKVHSEEKQVLEDRLKLLEEELKASLEKFELLEDAKKTSDEQHTTDVASLMSELNVLRNLSAEVEQLRKLEKEKEIFELEVSNLKDEIGSYKTLVDELREINSGTSQELAKMRADMEELKNAQDSRTADNEAERRRFEEEIEDLRKLSVEQSNTIHELEDEGENKFGVLLSQHEKELESLKEELEEQIAKKREQLSKDASAKRQRLKEEYEGKLRVLYEELVAEKTRMKDLMKLNESLDKKVNASQQENNLLTEEVERLKECEKMLAEEEQLTRDHEAKLQQIVIEYEEKISSLKERIRDIEATKQDDNNREFDSLKETEQSLKEYREKVQSLENLLNASGKEEERLQNELKTLEEKREIDLNKLSEVYDEKIKKSDEEIQQLFRRIEESQREHETNVQLMVDDIEVLKKQLDEVTGEKEKLQTMISHLDAAKQSVVQMYDEKIEVLVGELEEASHRASSAEENLREADQNFVEKQEELENVVTQLRDENKKLIEEHGESIHGLERTLNTEMESKEALQKKVSDLLEQLSNEKEQLEEKLDEASSQRKILVEEFEATRKLLEDELQSEKNESTRMREKIGEQEEKLTKNVAKLQEMDNLVTEKENTVATCEETIKVVSGELVVEKDKTSRMEKEMQALMANQSSEYVHSLERLRNDLKQEYEENTQQLKKNYENIFAKMEEEHRVSRDEKETEVESLKGMVENLEQLNQLKDDEHEVLLTELASNHDAQMGALRNGFEKEKVDLEVKVDSANKQLDEEKTEKNSLVEKHKVDLTALESMLVEQHQTKLKDVIHEAEVVKMENEQLKEEYEKEIESLKDQLTFENAFQVDLQSEHDKKLLSQKEAMEQEHKRHVEKINEDFQERIKKVDASRSEMEKEVNELTFRLEESQLELGVLKENLTNIHEAEMKKLEAQLQEKIQECENLRQQMGVEVVRLSTRVDVLSADKDALPNSEDAESVKLGYEVLLASLRVENNELGDQVQSLREEIQSANDSHQQEIDLTRAELERQHKQREDRINKKHSEELGKLMEKLEDLLQQENASKTLTEEHMQDIGALRAEFDQKFQRLLREKRLEIEESKRILEEQYKAKLFEYQERLGKKDLETKDLQNDVKVLLSRIDSIQTETFGQQKGLDKAAEELTKLRRENSELYRQLREEIAKSRVTSGGKGQKTIEQIQMENERLKKENENLKNLINRPSLVANGVDEASELNSHVLQLIKLMEQLVKEKNTLELKLRQEILDLKTRFGFLGDPSKTSLNGNSLLSVSLSPAKNASKDGLIEMLQELRENKVKQEEDIKAHILETETMMNEIKKMIDSTDFTDRRLQEMLKSQLNHLEQQRRVLVHRLWQLREKHKAVEEKISRQLEGLSSQSSPSDSARSKCYESIIEENLRREKELLALKRQQVEDLNARIAREKVALERHSEEKQHLERKMKEKDKLENELTSQRRDLERKWVGRLREKEFELKREQEFLEESKRRDELDGILRREPPLPKSTDQRSFKGLRADDRFSQASQTTKPAEPYRNEVREKPIEVTRSVAGLYGQIKDPVSKESKPNKRSDEWFLRRGREERDGVAVPRPTGTWSYKKSKRSSGKKEKLGAHRIEVHVPNLDLSSDDSDVDLGLPANDSYLLEVDLQDDSDIELYSTHSLDGLENLDEDWEVNLEEELKQISAWGVPSKVDRQKFKVMNGTRTREDARFGDTANRTTVDATFVPRVDLDMNWLRKLSFDYTHTNAHARDYTHTHTRNMHPRTSTAHGIEEYGEPFNLTDVSRIESELASLPKDTSSRQTVRGKELNPSKQAQGTLASGAGSASSHHAFDSVFPLQRKASKESGIDSPSSVRSEPAMSGKAVLSSRHVQRNDLIGGVYLLNVDEYVDRHMVKSSEEVARLRDLSPSEKRFDL